MFRSESKLPSLPPGIRIYAVGDIHGQLRLLEQLLQTIQDIEDAWPVERTIVVFLGDYIDRGPDSRGVIELLRTGLPERLEPVFLRGNHEEMMLRGFESEEFFNFWAMNGGLATARSYGVTVDEDKPVKVQDVFRICGDLHKALPKAHMDFMKALQIKVEAGDYMFVHAGVRPGVPLYSQSDRDCMFIRDEFLSYRGDFGKVIVHGHTPVDEPESLPNRIGIDTGAFFTGRLTAVCLEGESRRFLLASEDGG